MSAQESSGGNEVEDVLRRLEAAPRDPAAWERFYLRLWPYLLALAHRQVAGTPQCLLDAEDVAQEVFIGFARFWHSAAGERPRTEAKLRALLAAMTRHQGSDSRRRLLRERRDARRNVPLPEDGDLADMRPLVQAVVEFRDLMEHVEAALSPDDRRLLGMLVAGCAEVEIAKQLGVTDRTGRRRLGGVRAVIRKQLARPDLK